MFMILSAVSGASTPVVAKEVPAPIVETKKVSTEQYVKDYFDDIPVMIDIARCESHFRQFDKNGEIYRGMVNNQDVGVMQINEHYHLDIAEKGNYNIYSLSGNTAYARALYEKSGTAPWISSRPCWGNSNSARELAMNK